MRGRYKDWTPGYIDAHPEVSPRNIELADPYYSHPRLVLEIGSGKGGFLTQMGLLHPEINYLGLERDVSSCGTAARKAVELSLTNVRFLNLDFDVAFFPLSSLRFEKIHVNFPDPWPKARHEKRRLLFPTRLSNILSLLAPDGLLEFRTDNLPLFEYALEHLEEAGASLLEPPYPEEEARSEYEERFLAEGIKINRALIGRKG